MNDNYYSSDTMVRFMKDTLCGGDPVTYKHYVNDNMKFFRKRLKDPKQVEQVVYVMCTNILRDAIFDVIGKTTEYMKPWGDLIVTGGEAFNNYFEQGDRVVSSDIDTKFVPTFMSPFKQKFFGYLQHCKLHLWNHMGKIAKQFNTVFRSRVKALQGTKVGKLLGIRMSRDPVSLRRRYTLIKKSKRDNVLIDVELFALDLKLRYYSPEDGKIAERNLGGILDIAMMRPLELGYEIAFTRQRGIYYKNPVTAKNIYNKRILIASKQFLIEDLYLMKSLGLRPEKAQKDKKRMVTFAKKVLNLSVTAKTSDDDIFKKSLKVLGSAPHRLPRVARPPIKLRTRVNPFTYQKYTTPTQMSTLKKLYVPGIKTKHYTQIQGFEKTNSRLYFNTKAKNWKPSRNPYYVRNMYNFRPEKMTNVATKPMKPENILYGRDKSRNAWMPRTLLRKSAVIPFVGLKKNTIKTLLK